MNLEAPHRYPQNAALGYPQHYYYNERNIPLAVAHGARPDARGYPLGGPVGGPRLRGGMGREDGGTEAGQRRRIAVACARCRKRKIRCSGDPGDGSGCINCKQAGVDPSACQFHRVGSNEAVRVLDSINLANNLTNMANTQAMMSIYSAPGAPLYSRPMPNQYPPLDTRAVYSQSWTVPTYSEEASPVETYNLDQSGPYLSNQNTLANGSVYSGDYRWSQSHGKPLPNVTGGCFAQDSASAFGSNGLPYIQPDIRTAATSEALSPMDMTSLYTSLPERPRPQPIHSSEATVPQRQLPIPQPSPAQTSRNVVDQLQDQRLRSAQAKGSSISNCAPYSKRRRPFNSDNEFQATAPVATSSASLAGASMPIASTTDSSISYVSITPSVSEGATASSVATQTQLNFGTSALLDAMPAPAIPATYSNFRNYNLPTSASTETLSSIARQSSQTNLYSFTSDSGAKRQDSSSESALVSGHRYTPLSPSRSHPQHQTTHDGLGQDSFNDQSPAIHRPSMSSLDHGF